jgi:hypothetical protein
VASGREVAGSLTKRVIDEFRRSGNVPPELVSHIQAAAWANGRTPSAEDVERAARDWMNERMATNDRKPTAIKHADDKVDRAVEALLTSPPTGWGDAVAVVENAWRAGELSDNDQRRLDGLDAMYGAKLGV